MGTLVGIARAVNVRGPLEEIRSVEVSREKGLKGDRRGAVKGAQVTVLAREDWEAACSDIGEDLPWTTRRANLFVEGLEMPQRIGAQVRIGDVVLVVREETDPCLMMEKARPGLRAALTPDWRGGIRCDVVEGGTLSLGVEVAFGD